MAKQHIIELNGKRYDALTGHTVGMQPVPKTSDNQSSRSSARSVDGFTRRAKSTSRPQSKAPTYKLERSKTLMRQSVRKPVAKKVRSVRPKPLTGHLAVPTKRLAHAEAVPKNKLITRFGSAIYAGPAYAVARTADIKPLVNHLSSNIQSIAAKAMPITDKAMASAVSHKQPKPKKPARHVRLANKLHISARILNGGAIVLAGLLIMGFFTYQNLPGLNMRLASARAGVHGSLPGNKPAGFGIGSISYKPGEITVGFKSNSDNRNFKIIQTASSWNSETLAQNFAVLKSSPTITIPDKGKTVYIYNGSNATWVDSGVWYRVEGDSSLSSTQLLNIASSL